MTQRKYLKAPDRHRLGRALLFQLADYMDTDEDLQTAEEMLDELADSENEPVT